MEQIAAISALRGSGSIYHNRQSNIRFMRFNSKLLTLADLDTLAVFVEDKRRLTQWVSMELFTFMFIKLVVSKTLPLPPPPPTVEGAGRAHAGP